MANETRQQLLTLCPYCQERLAESYYLNPVNGSRRRGKCEWCKTPSAEVEQYEYRSKRELTARARSDAHADRARGGRDTRARYRGSWREDM